MESRKSKFSHLPGVDLESDTVFTYEAPAMTKIARTTEQKEIKGILSDRLSVRDSIRKFHEENILPRVQTFQSDGGINPLKRFQEISNEIVKLEEEMRSIKEGNIYHQILSEKEVLELKERLHHIDERYRIKDGFKTMIEEVVNEKTVENNSEKKQNSNELAKMEESVSRLEKIIGLHDMKSIHMEENFLDTLSSLEKQIFMLDDSNLENVRQQIHNLNKDIKTLEATKIPPQKKEIDRMYEQVKEASVLVGIIPQIIERLLSLKSVHDDTINRSEDIKTVEATQTELKQLLKSHQEALIESQKKFQDNLSIIINNCKYLDNSI